MSFIILSIIYAFFITFLNVRNCILPKEKRIHEFTLDIFGTFAGLFMTFCVYSLYDITTSDYDEAIYTFQYHAPLHSKYGIIIMAIIIIGLICLIKLGISKPEKSPPLVSAFSIAFVLLCLVAMFFVHIQLMNHIENTSMNPFSNAMLFCWLYYANIVILAIRRIKFHIDEHVRLANEREMVYRTKFGEWLGKIMSKVSSMTIFSFALVFPLLAVFEILYIITGQGTDGFIKAFTMTADWTFSTQTPPPPLQYQGHYLCTVSAGGHRKIVKPLRYGKRMGEKIIVNRQLLVANAFEDLIKEKLPRFHKFVRGIYDNYGYPISKHITTPFRADIVYILMKPLEYIFTISLYLFDNQPENRIAVQYSDYKKEKF